MYEVVIVAENSKKETPLGFSVAAKCKYHIAYYLTYVESDRECVVAESSGADRENLTGKLNVLNTEFRCHYELKLFLSYQFR